MKVTTDGGTLCALLDLIIRMLYLFINCNSAFQQTTYSFSKLALYVCIHQLVYGCSYVMCNNVEVQGDQLIILTVTIIVLFIITLIVTLKIILTVTTTVTTIYQWSHAVQGKFCKAVSHIMNNCNMLHTHTHRERERERESCCLIYIYHCIIQRNTQGKQVFHNVA